MWVPRRARGTRRPFPACRGDRTVIVLVTCAPQAALEGNGGLDEQGAKRAASGPCRTTDLGGCVVHAVGSARKLERVALCASRSDHARDFGFGTAAAPALSGHPFPDPADARRA